MRNRRRYRIPDSCLLSLTSSETPNWRSPPGLQLADNPSETRRPDEMVYLVPVQMIVFTETSGTACFLSEVTAWVAPDRVRSSRSEDCIYTQPRWPPPYFSQGHLPTTSQLPSYKSENGPKFHFKNKWNDLTHAKSSLGNLSDRLEHQSQQPA